MFHRHISRSNLTIERTHMCSFNHHDYRQFGDLNELVRFLADRDRDRDDTLNRMTASLSDKLSALVSITETQQLVDADLLRMMEDRISTRFEQNYVKFADDTIPHELNEFRAEGLRAMQYVDNILNDRMTE